MKSKRKCQIEHFKRRLDERYGLQYSKYLFDTLIHSIQNQKAKLIYRQSLRISIFDVEYKTRIQDWPDCSSNASVKVIKIRCVYDKIRKSIATVLDLAMNPFELNLEFECED